MKLVAGRVTETRLNETRLNEIGYEAHDAYPPLDTDPV